MLSLHCITHAITLAVIATLVKKYLVLQYELEKVEHSDACHYPDQERLHTSQPHDPDTPSHSNVSTLWCSGARSERICDFQNLCYNTLHDQFVFIHGAGSSLQGATFSELHSNFLDLSSVKNHNIHHFRAIDIPETALHDFHVQWVTERSLIFNRFKPDNIMHVFHDDILPMYQSLKSMSLSDVINLPPYDIRLVLTEGWDIDEYRELYSIFTKYDILNLELLKRMDGNMVCFRRGRVGLLKDLVWYQYGFTVPQGPTIELKVTSQNIREPIYYLLNTHTVDSDGTIGEYIVLISRKETRLILNEADLVFRLTQETGYRVLVVSEETHTFSEIMHTVHNSKGLIGMHGSLLIVSAFLKPSAVLLELFPFAIDADNYTPFKTLCEIKGMGIVYKSWTNEDKSKTVGHPDWPRERGGIQYLTIEEQDEIMNQTDVPHHLCCEDPSWLYHAYQDTVVDVDTVVSHFQELLSHNDVEGGNQSLLPGPLQNAKCVAGDGDNEHGVLLSWEWPWNLKYITYTSIECEIWIQEVLTGKTKALIIDSVSSLDISSHISLSQRTHIWLRAVLDGEIHGQFTNVVTCDS